ncbi:hypothetical protein KQH42_30420, partial [Streptomyces sp. CHA1]|uniref:hypothetical protein n=1 Tax=Streptomyces sp. CHA1 TaxID=2841663 RepID=UPI0020943126
FPGLCFSYQQYPLFDPVVRPVPDVQFLDMIKSRQSTLGRVAYIDFNPLFCSKAVGIIKNVDTGDGWFGQCWFPAL